MPNQKEEVERRASPAEAAARDGQSGEESSKRRVVEVARSRSHSSISDVSRSRSRSPLSPRRAADERSHAPIDADSAQRFPKRPPTSENKVLAVFGLHLDVTEHELDGLYRPYGAKFCKIIWDKYKNMSKGFGFIYFDNVADAVKAKNATEGLKLKNKEFRLDFSLGERDYTKMIMSKRSPQSPPPQPSSLERRRRHDSRERPAPYHHRPFDYERRPPAPHHHAPPSHHHISRGHPGAHSRDHYNSLPQHESYRARDDPRYSREIRRFGGSESERSRGRFDYREETTSRYVPPAPQSRSTYSNGSSNSSRHSMAMTPPSPRSPRFAARRESTSRSRSRSREYRHARRANHHQHHQEEPRLIRA